jgi:hypothetical protein
MADLSKIKQSGKNRNRFGDLPSPGEKSTVLEAPENAPAEPVKAERKARAKTNRIKRWGTTVAPDFPKRIKRLCAELEVSQVELLERWLDEEEKKQVK